ISRVNLSEATVAIELSADFVRLLDAADVVHVASNGRFDLTIGPLTELWGFGRGETRRDVPIDTEVEQARLLVGQRTVIERAGNRLVKTKDGVTLSVDAIAKGMGIDSIVERLEALGVRDYLVEIGGDLRVAGQGPSGTGWRIGIEKPDASLGTVEERITVSDVAMATSGDYRRFFEHDRVRYAHIIDPTTGRPVNHDTTSVTVFADSAALADAWATALLVLGREQGITIAEKNGIAALFLDRTDDSAVFQRYPTIFYAVWSQP
ncbi:MAG: FAD:protein FMN transferase, partial [Pseudomonadota bacterium]